MSVATVQTGSAALTAMPPRPPILGRDPPPDDPPAGATASAQRAAEATGAPPSPLREAEMPAHWRKRGVLSDAALRELSEHRPRLAGWLESSPLALSASALVGAVFVVVDALKPLLYTWAAWGVVAEERPSVAVLNLVKALCDWPAAYTRPLPQLSRTHGGMRIWRNTAYQAVFRPRCSKSGV